MNETPFVIANLKANLTWDKISAWLDAVGPIANNFKGTIVFCPSYPFLIPASEKIKASGLQIKLGTQDISGFEQGSHTGEVTASQLKGIAGFAIIGHSERRQSFDEADAILQIKVENAKNAQIEPIFCVQSADTPPVAGVKIVAYEPVFAIGTGNPDTPENIKSVAERLKLKEDFTVLYGGSVSSDNVKSFLIGDFIDGVLVGSTNSLDPQKFIAIVQALK